MQADLLEEAALETRGGGEHVNQHLLYGNLVSQAQAAELSGDMMSAKGRYREALTMLESQRQKRAVDRLNILAKLLSLTGEQQLVQRSSLFSDIEDSVAAIFCGVKVSTRDGLERIALLYDLCGKTAQSANLRSLVALLAPKVVTSQNAVPDAYSTLSNQAPEVHLQGIVEISVAETVPLLSVEVDDAEEL